MPPVLAVRTASLSENPEAFFALVRTCGRCLTGNCAALTLLVLATTAAASGQTLVVTTGGSTVSQGATLSIGQPGRDCQLVRDTWGWRDGFVAV